MARMPIDIKRCCVWHCPSNDMCIHFRAYEQDDKNQVSQYVNLTDCEAQTLANGKCDEYEIVKVEP